jgi:hypothetical protein
MKPNYYLSHGFSLGGHLAAHASGVALRFRADQTMPIPLSGLGTPYKTSKVLQFLLPLLFTMYRIENI